MRRNRDTQRYGLARSVALQLRNIMRNPGTDVPQSIPRSLSIGGRGTSSGIPRDPATGRALDLPPAGGVLDLTPTLEPDDEELVFYGPETRPHINPQSWRGHFGFLADTLKLALFGLSEDDQLSPDELAHHRRGEYVSRLLEGDRALERARTIQEEYDTIAAENQRG